MVKSKKFKVVAKYVGLFKADVDTFPTKEEAEKEVKRLETTRDTGVFSTYFKRTLKFNIKEVKPSLQQRIKKKLKM